VELPHKLDAIRFMADNRKLLVDYGSTVWLHDAATGTRVWERVLEDREEKGVKLFPEGDRFRISPTNHTLGCYSAAKGEKLWEIPVEKVSQNEYSRADSVSENITRVSYQDWRVQVDLASGKVLWSGRISRSGSLRVDCLAWG
jgi:outer membrane protein assembly factor BamB